MTDNAQTLRTPRQVSEREIAITLVIALAESGLPSFSLAGYYEDDEDFVNTLAERLNVQSGKSFVNKVRKVTRILVNADVLIAERATNDRWYAGQSGGQMEYRLRPGKATLLTHPASDCSMGPEGEAAFLIRRAYPNPELDD